MSFILEALKKAEREREARATPKRHTLFPRSPRPARRAWPWAAALLLNGAVLAVGLLLLRPDGSETSPETQAAVPGRDTPPAAEAREFPPHGAEESREAPSDRQPRPDSPERSAASAARLGTPTRLAEPRPELSAEAPPDHGRQPALPAAPARDASLAPETRMGVPGPRAPRKAARAEPERGHAETDLPALPRFEQMSPEVQAAVPDLRLNLIAYAADPSERLVYIKNRRYLEGETVEGAFKIEAIRREGVILNHQGQRFLLLP